MRVPIENIGDSRGLRLSNAILDRYNIEESVELELHENHIIIKPSKVRSGWDQAFKEMNQNNDDRLLIDDVFEDEEIEPWS